MTMYVGQMKEKEPLDTLQFEGQNNVQQYQNGPLNNYYGGPD